MRETRWIVLHRPGPAWQPGVPLFEQLGLQAHVEHYRAWQAGGRLEAGGPYIEGGDGGMMVAAAAVEADELRRHAAADPAVVSGLLTFELRKWLVAMRGPGAGVS